MQIGVWTGMTANDNMTCASTFQNGGKIVGVKLYNESSPREPRIMMFNVVPFSSVKCKVFIGPGETSGEQIHPC